MTDLEYIELACYRAEEQAVKAVGTIGYSRIFRMLGEEVRRIIEEIEQREHPNPR